MVRLQDMRARSRGVGTDGGARNAAFEADERAVDLDLNPVECAVE